MMNSSYGVYNHLAESWRKNGAAIDPEYLRALQDALYSTQPVIIPYEEPKIEWHDTELYQRLRDCTYLPSIDPVCVASITCEPESEPEPCSDDELMDFLLHP